MESKKGIIIAAITIAVLVVGVLGASYAYFAATIGTGSTSNVTVTSKTLDSLTFTAGSALSLTLTQSNMAKGSSDTTLSGTAVSPYVKLVGRNDQISTYCYDISVKTTTNNATGQAEGTVKVVVTPVTATSAVAGATTANNNTACGTLDVTKKTANDTTVICSKQQILTASAGGTQANQYTANVQFVNYKDTDQTSLAGKTVYSGQLIFTRVSC